MRATVLLALPVLGASLLQQINSFTDKLFASSLEAGRVAALSFANALGSAPRTVLLFPLLTPLFPLIARMVAERRTQETVSAFQRAAGLLALVAIPVSAFVALAATDITQLAFGRGACDADCVEQTASPLVFYGLAVWGNFIGYLLNRTLSAATRARDIMVATIVTVALTIALDIVLIGPLEQAGLALASAIAVYVNTVLTLIYLRRRFPALSLRVLGRQQGRLLACGLAGAGVFALLGLGLDTSGRGSWAVAGLLAVKGLIALAVYLALARVLAPAELAEGRRSVAAVVRRRARAA
jgi:putative peptidoglycan lipid II flippase